jgi:hypothetical protein
MRQVEGDYDISRGPTRNAYRVVGDSPYTGLRKGEGVVRGVAWRGVAWPSAVVVGGFLRVSSSMSKMVPPDQLAGRKASRVVVTLSGTSERSSEK